MTLLKFYQSEVAFKARISSKIPALFKRITVGLICVFALLILVITFSNVNRGSSLSIIGMLICSIMSYLAAMYIQRWQTIKVIMADTDITHILSKNMMGFDYDLFNVVSVDKIKIWMNDNQKGKCYLEYIIASYQKQNDKERINLKASLAFFIVVILWILQKLVTNIFEFLQVTLNIIETSYTIVGVVIILLFFSFGIYKFSLVFLEFNNDFEDREALLRILLPMQEEVIEN